jgi:hypothetical protein
MYIFDDMDYFIQDDPLYRRDLWSIPIVQATRCTCYLKLFILVKRSTCFGRSFRPSSGAQNCVYRNGVCQIAAAVCCYRGWGGAYLKLFILVKHSTCFGRSFRLPSRAQNCVYSNGICQTAAATCCYRGWDGTAVWHIPLLYRQFWAPDDGRKDCPKSVERFTKINNLR